ncbi:hypothetical protein EGR_07981 [Echinococcus granulosus]|uniref:DUF5727 domain-containing protein n=1 Tax=Echinococcus granulosus TaxID=6210 RepID=W6UUT3_ECHGR|nr:hypothetical protein EGR_07981 [Echinococcus granulosus]EUB57164.1 hypothetical protein EGR_07981 [Echinococcus granulosus]
MLKEEEEEEEMRVIKLRRCANITLNDVSKQKCSILNGEWRACDLCDEEPFAYLCVDGKQNEEVQSANILHAGEVDLKTSFPLSRFLRGQSHVELTFAVQGANSESLQPIVDVFINTFEIFFHITIIYVNTSFSIKDLTGIYLHLTCALYLPEVFASTNLCKQCNNLFGVDKTRMLEFDPTNNINRINFCSFKVELFPILTFVVISLENLVGWRQTGKKDKQGKSPYPNILSIQQFLCPLFNSPFHLSCPRLKSELNPSFHESHHITSSHCAYLVLPPSHQRLYFKPQDLLFTIDAISPKVNEDKFCMQILKSTILC